RNSGETSLPSQVCKGGISAPGSNAGEVMVSAMAASVSARILQEPRTVQRGCHASTPPVRSNIRERGANQQGSPLRLADLVDRSARGRRARFRSRDLGG